MIQVLCSGTIDSYRFALQDEAHQIEDVATQYFGLVVSSMRVEELVRDIDALCGTHSFGKTLSKLRLQLRRSLDVSKQMFAIYVKKEERYRLRPDRITKEQSQLHHMFVQELSIVRDSLEEISNPDEVSVALVQRIDELFVDLKTAGCDILTNLFSWGRKCLLLPSKKLRDTSGAGGAA